MELFDKQYIYLEWDNILEGKEVLVADTLSELRKRVYVGKNDFLCTVKKNDGDYPFIVNEVLYAFAYYDPNYTCKLAYMQGKMIQYRNKDSSDPWKDCSEEPFWTEACEYRVKPEQEKKWRPFKSIEELKQAWENKRVPCVCSELVEPHIWVRKKSSGITSMINSYDYRNSKYPIVVLGRKSMQELFDEWEFLDGTPCGVEE